MTFIWPLPRWCWPPWPFTLHVTLFLVAALWALQRGRDGWAGVWLAATSIKPQMVVFIAPWLVLWAVGQRRWRLVWGLLAGGGLLLLASLPLFPRWPISLLEDVQRYSGVAGGLRWATASGHLLSLVRSLRCMPGLESALRLGPAGATDVVPSASTALGALGLSVLLNGAIAACFYCIARAVGLAYPWSLLAAGFPVTELSLLLAVPPGGLGLFDAGWYGVLLLGWVQHPALVDDGEVRSCMTTVAPG